LATNKHATIRYHALDRCFSNFGRRYFIENLTEACNEALYEFSGIEDGVKRRQVFDDIAFMESEHGWSVPLERIKDGKRVYYRYEDKSFSIKNQGINQSEAEQLNETVSILSRFQGLPQFEWVEEIKVRLQETFHLKGNSQVTVGFEQNPYLKGLSYFSDLFTAIQNHDVLKITYKGFRELNEKQLLFHPWYLKQYNSRWFAFGFNQMYQGLSNLAIDRITNIEGSSEPYIANENIDFNEFFEDVIGVTVKPEVEPVKVLLKVNLALLPYIESKPIHGSQKPAVRTEKEGFIEIHVQINHELISTLFSYMDGIEIMEPEALTQIFKSKAEGIIEKYK
jgi:predicted DNA-binding transcriptional regulator YafY